MCVCVCVCVFLVSAHPQSSNRSILQSTKRTTFQTNRHLVTNTYVYNHPLQTPLLCITKLALQKNIGREVKLAAYLPDDSTQSHVDSHRSSRSSNSNSSSSSSSSSSSQQDRDNKDDNKGLQLVGNDVDVKGADVIIVDDMIDTAGTCAVCSVCVCAAISASDPNPNPPLPLYIHIHVHTHIYTHKQI